ncbi:MAG: glutaminyl-peptide cyclotransferase [Alistipes sp.]|nr:glutaminyl-peptide cyclotransferase [Candidatus Minthomonas equi]
MERIVVCLVLLAFVFSHSEQIGAENTAHPRCTEYSVIVDKTYIHDKNAYTQGLFFYEGEFYESIGQWGESAFRKVKLETGEVLSEINYPEDVFIEGSCVAGGYLYVLTWTNHKCYMYDLSTMTKLSEFSYPGEGWGMTTNGKELIMSDGSSRLHFLNPASFTRIRSIDVKMNGADVQYLNELEYIDGKIWANVYLQDYIVIINPGTGEVEGKVDCRNLLPSSLRTSRTDVLNGIAYDRKDGGIYLTGKYWPRLYKITLKEKGNKK